MLHQDLRPLREPVNENRWEKTCRILIYPCLLSSQSGRTCFKNSFRKGVEIKADFAGHMDNCEFWKVPTQLSFLQMWQCMMLNAFCSCSCMITKDSNSSFMSFNESRRCPTCETALLRILAGLVQKQEFSSRTGLFSICSSDFWKTKQKTFCIWWIWFLAIVSQLCQWLLYAGILYVIDPSNTFYFLGSHQQFLERMCCYSLKLDNSTIVEGIMERNHNPSKW